MPDTLSVVVPTQARERYLRPALSDLVAQDLPAASLEVVVVDDSIGGGAAQLVRDVAAGSPVDLRYERTDGGDGPNAARNVGIERSEGAFVVLVDDDCRFPPGWLRALAAGIEAAPGADCLGGPVAISLEPGHPRWCGRDPFPITWLDHGDEDRWVDWLVSANMAVPRATFDRLGPFDPGQPIYGDETEWLLRLRRAGGLMRYVAAAEVEHTRLAPDVSRRRLLGSARLRARRLAAFDRDHQLASPRVLTLRHALRVSAHAVRRRCWGGAAHALEAWIYLPRATR